MKSGGNESKWMDSWRRAAAIFDRPEESAPHSASEWMACAPFIGGGWNDPPRSCPSPNISKCRYSPFKSIHRANEWNGLKVEWMNLMKTINCFLRRESPKGRGKAKWFLCVVIWIGWAAAPRLFSADQTAALRLNSIRPASFFFECGNKPFTSTSDAHLRRLQFHSLADSFFFFGN